MGPGAQDRKDKENQRTWTILQLGKEREYLTRSILVSGEPTALSNEQSSQFLPCVTIRSDEEQTPIVFHNFDNAVVLGSVT